MSATRAWRSGGILTMQTHNQGQTGGRSCSVHARLDLSPPYRDHLQLDSGVPQPIVSTFIRLVIAHLSYILPGS